MEDIADKLVGMVNAQVAKLTIGRPEDNADITCVVSESSANFIEGLVTDARDKGAHLCQVGTDGGVGRCRHPSPTPGRRIRHCRRNTSARAT